jgi:chromosome segregation ATPase
MPSDDLTQKIPIPPPPPRPGPTRLELAREIEALRLAVREREGWIDELRRELDERDASLGWHDQEARAATAEAAAARREATQFREDRDHARHQLHARTEELTQANGRIEALEAEARDLKTERRRRKEEMLELRAKLLEGAAEDPGVTAERERAAAHGREVLERELAETRLALQQAKETLTGLADEMAALQDEVATEAAAAMAGRAREIELLQRLSSQADELTAVRAELDEQRAVIQGLHDKGLARYPEGE